MGLTAVKVTFGAVAFAAVRVVLSPARAGLPVCGPAVAPDVDDGESEG
jgi:hypothetical protein